MMVSALLVCSGLLAVLADESSAASSGSPAALSAYREAEAGAGKGSDAQVKLALWCEARGLSAERMKHLARAVLTDPGNASARGLMGLVAYGGRWTRPEAVAEQVRADEGLTAALAEYNARRERTPETADAQWKLALWCEQQGLKAEALAHLTAVTRLDPTRVNAWKHLGYKLQGGRWMPAEAIAALAAEARAQARADRLWKPRFERWKGLLAQNDKNRKVEVERALAGVTDPRAVPAVVAVLGAGNAQSQRLAVQVLSSRALADVAVFARSDAIRRAAAETLRRRDPREFVNRLIARLDEPIHYHVKPVAGPGQPGELIVEGAGAGFNLDRVYDTPPLPAVVLSPGSTFEFDLNGLLVLNIANAVSGTAVLNSLTPPLTWAMITQSLEPVFRTPLNTRTLVMVQGTRQRSPDGVARMIAAILGANSGLAAVPFILDPRAMWVASPDGMQTQAPIAPGSLAWAPNPGGAPAMPQPAIPVPIGQMVREIEKTAYEARGQQRDDVRAIELKNASIRKVNDAVVIVLTAVLGRSPGETRSEWERWWTDQRGYATSTPPLASRPIVYEDVVLTYQPQPIGRFLFDREVGYYTPPTTSSSCFAAGTPVRTLNGERPIETIKVGDRVLAQDTHTGALSYQPVIAVHHNPPAATLRVEVDGDTVVATAIHRFWKAHQGWVMARDLKPGDTVRTLGGTARVRAIESGISRPVYNLDVASGHDFFVGSAGLLVHDHTIVEPVETPFDSALARSE
jgi:tetratricopeptide (TPR) repeat protein